tara:strand:+ start:12409 stop:13677 length:1269 start_codon:yes stop_codon:yes gene_type:complete
VQDTSVGALFIALIALICLSGFFSGSETGMMSLNRYRLRHLARAKNRAALRVSRLLERPDRILGVILIGNTFANILASAIATVIAVRLFGEIGVVIATVILTLVVLIFAEIAPKTLAALFPQRIAFIVSWPLQLLLKILYPVVWLATAVANTILRAFGVKVGHRGADRLTSEELRTVVMESAGRITSHHQEMLLRILDIEKVTVDDVMIPRSEIVGINLDDDWADISQQITGARHTKLPMYRGDINNVQGILHMRDALRLLSEGRLDKASLEKTAREVYFVPEVTPLNIQLLNFRSEKQRLALVVDEYGDIQGLVSLEDVLEELVGEFAGETPSVSKFVTQAPDGSYMVDGSVNIRELNRLMEWEFPTTGPKTLNGLIIEYLETIPEHSACLRLNGYPVEVVEIKDNRVKQVRIYPALRKSS